MKNPMFKGKSRNVSTPRRKAAGSNENPLEKKEGMGITSYVRGHYPDVLFAHVANEEQEKKIAEGLVSGYPDYVLNQARGGYFGLLIELKRRLTGTPSDKQLKVGCQLADAGYAFAVCAGYPEAKEIVDWYMSLPLTIGSCEASAEPDDYIMPTTKHENKIVNYRKKHLNE